MNTLERIKIIFSGYECLEKRKVPRWLLRAAYNHNNAEIFKGRHFIYKVEWVRSGKTVVKSNGSTTIELDILKPVFYKKLRH